MQERHLSDLADTLFKSLGESLGAQAPPSALLIHPLHCTPGTGRSCSVTWVASSANSSPALPLHAPLQELAGALGAQDSFLNHLEGPLTKGPPPWQNPLGTGPADLGQLWLVAYTGSQPLGICQTDSHPPAPSPSLASPLAPAPPTPSLSPYCSPKEQTPATFSYLWHRLSCVSTQLWPCFRVQSRLTGASWMDLWI